MLSKSKKFLEEAIASEQMSAAGFYFSKKGEPQAEWYLGQHSRFGLDVERRATAADSLFDLASMTKPLSTVSLLFSAESEGKIAWQDPIQKYFSQFPSSETTILDLMCHRSGLPAHFEYFRRYNCAAADKPSTIPLGDQKPLFNWIYETGLPNKGQQVYSDLGFIMLGFLLESVYGKPLPELFVQKIATPLKLENCGFVTLPHAAAPTRMFGFLAEKSRFVATERCPWRGKILQGEVHDDNTWSFGGYAGHAGLFATVRDAAKLFEHLWKKAKACPAFVNRKQEAPGVFSYGMATYPGLRPFPGPAWETSLGHTGFTGTSVWYHEPSGALSVLLTNRVHPARSDNRWIEGRLEFHKLLWEEAGL